MSNGDSTKEFPTWVRAIAFIVGTVGVPAAFTAFLLAQSAGYVPSLDSQNQDSIKKIYRILHDHRMSAENDLYRIEYGLYFVCLRTAKDADDVRRCTSIIRNRQPTYGQGEE